MGWIMLDGVKGCIRVAIARCIGRRTCPCSFAALLVDPGCVLVGMRGTEDGNGVGLAEVGKPPAIRGADVGAPCTIRWRARA